MKKLLLVFLALISFTTFMGCEKIQSNTIKSATELVYESLSEKEEYLLNLTGNKVLMYKLNNIPGDKKYEILLTYEVYEKGEKVKEESIMGIMQDSPSGEMENKTIGINFQNGKMKTLVGSKSGYSSNSYDVEEDLSKYSQAFLVNDINLIIGTEVYIYYANSVNSISTSIPLGVPIDLNVTKDILKDSESNILIKLSFKEK